MENSKQNDDLELLKNQLIELLYYCSNDESSATIEKIKKRVNLNQGYKI